MGIQNLISQAEFEKKFILNSDEYKTLTDIDNQDQIFSKTNAFHLLPMKKMRQNCNDFHNRILSDGTSTRFSNSDMKKSRSIPIAQKDTIVRSNFPDVWIYDVQETANGQITLEKLTPDSITTWMLNGFSINAEKGFSVAKTQKVNVFKDFFIKIEKPHSAKPSEIVSIKVIVYNFMSNDASTTITMTKSDDQFDFMDGNRASSEQTRSSAKMVKEGESAVVIFNIKPKKTNIILNIEAKSGTNKDAAQESFTVEAPGIGRSISKSDIIDMRTGESHPLDFRFDIPINIVKDSVKCEANAATNLIGPALTNVGRLM